MTRHSTILLRSGWQTVNIGDVAHTPGALRVLEKYAPEAELILWPRSIGEREREMFRRYFPAVDIAEGHLDSQGHPSTDALARAFDRADLLVHGSGPHAVCADDVEAWWRKTRKPFGFFGITHDPVSPPTEASLAQLKRMLDALPLTYTVPSIRDLYNHADFLYCRDSASSDFLRRQGITTPTLEFGPDATFGFDLRDETAVREILMSFELRMGEFLCLVPGTRWTPYYEIRDLLPTHEDLRREAVTAATIDEDMAGFRTVIEEWVRTTGLPVLICPEMTYQVELAQRRLAEGYDPAVAAKVHVLPQYWGPVEAASVYAHATAVASIECHSPILALAGGTPAVYLRNPADTVKGQMYADLGADEWLVEMQQGWPRRFSDTLAAIHDDPDGARRHAVAVHERAESLLQSMTHTALGFSNGE